MTFFVGVTCMGWTWLTFPMFVPEIAEELQLGAARAQFLFGTISLSLVMTGILGGTLGSFCSERWIVGTGVLLVGISAVLRSFLAGYSGMVIASLCTGLGLGLVIPNLVHTLGIWFPRKELGFANGVRMTGERAGAAVAQGILVGSLIGYFNGWRPVQLVLGSATIIVAITWILFYRDPARAGETNPSHGLLDELFESTKVLFSDPSMLALGSIAFVHSYSFFSYVGLLPTWLLKFQFVPGNSVGLYSSLLFWVLIAGGLLVPSLSDFVPDRKLILIPITMVMGLGIIATGSSGSRLALVPAIVVTGLAAGGLIPLVFTLINERMDVGSSRQSAEAGFLLSASQPGVVVGPSIGGFLFEQYGVLFSAVTVGGPIFLVGLCLGVRNWIRNAQ